MRHRNGLLFVCLAAGCFGDSSELAEKASAINGSPSLALGDTFLPFRPGVFGYQWDRGTEAQRDVFFNFGVATTTVFPALDILPHDDVPDHKMRVRVTISETDPLQNPSGDIIVHGLVYERDWNDPLGGVATTVAVTAPALHFVSNGTLTTSTYFDQVTSVETPGLGMNAKLEVELWDGHEQEMQVGVRIDDVTDEATCETEWRVYFNGQAALPEWDATTSTCSAGLIPSGAERGMYFGLVRDEDEEDAFHHFVNAGPDPTVPHGHISTPTTWEGWLNRLPAAARPFFVVEENGTDETRIRPIVVELERQSDLQVVDSARMLLTIAEDAFGNPSLVAKLASAENPGAIAQLSPRGLDRLEPTHASTLPYPIVPAGTQPRLSESAIAHAEHTSVAIDVDLADLPEDDRDYWTKANTAPQPNEGEFAGYLAYQDILAQAKQQKVLFDASIKACSSTPNPAACETAIRTSFCVENDPNENDFRLHITGIDTYFDPSRPLDALVIGDVTGMDLSFGTNQILSDYTLRDIQGWLMATIDPANIQIEWDKGLLDPCTIKPTPRVLADPEYADGVDYADWLTCRDLSFTAGSGTLADPLAFDVAKNGESIDTPLASGTPTVNLASVGAATGTGICEDDWLMPTIESEILSWETDVESTIAIELATSPGQDEALNRLLSPYELGVERVDTPPPGTPPYDVHPLATYDLSATIGASAGDTFGAHANATDGLYIPYLTRSSPTDAVPFISWFCPVIAGQLCNDLAGWHEPMLEGGLDPNGVAYDVAVNYTTAHINQALWAQARRADHLGSPNFPARLTLADNAVVNLATLLGFTDVTAALTPLGSKFGVRYYQQAAPYTIITDGVGLAPPKMLYVIPNIVVELVSIAGDGTETVVAKFLVDVVDRDFHVQFTTGGVPELTASWGQRSLVSLTSTNLPDCFGSRTIANSCEARLRLVVGALWWPQVDDMLLDMIEQTPALQLFDAGGESNKPRHLKNVRTFLVNEGVSLVGDLCKPGSVDCP